MQLKIKNLQTIYDNKISDYEAQLKNCEEKKKVKIKTLPYYFKKILKFLFLYFNILNLILKNLIKIFILFLIKYI